MSASWSAAWGLRVPPRPPPSVQRSRPQSATCGQRKEVQGWWTYGFLPSRTGRGAEPPPDVATGSQSPCVCCKAGYTAGESTVTELAGAKPKTSVISKASMWINIVILCFWTPDTSHGSKFQKVLKNIQWSLPPQLPTPPHPISWSDYQFLKYFFFPHLKYFEEFPGHWKSVTVLGWGGMCVWIFHNLFNQASFDEGVFWFF